jgi:SulP family sulfate permease
MSAAPVPSATDLPRNPLAGEIWGGFAAMLVALPSAIAYGVAIYALLGPDYVALGVRAGILGAIAMGLVAPLLGGAPRLISAPSAPAAAVLAALASELLAGTAGNGAAVEPGRIVVLLTLVALLAGALQFLYGAVGGGRLIKYIPYPVVSGYLSGVGVLIFLSQVPKFLGLATGTSPWSGVVSPGLWQWPALVVGAITISGFVLGPKLTKAVPATIFGLLAGLLAYFGIAAFRPELLELAHNKLVIGPVGGSGGAVFSGFATRWAATTALRLADLQLVWMPALTLSVLLSIDTLKTCVVVDALTRSRHNSNRELIGQGAGNLASALIGGMPGSGTMGATLVNVESGGRTRLSGEIEGAFVLAAFLVFGGLMAWVPVSALAGILFIVAFRMFDWRCFRLLRQRATMLDFFVSATVVIVAVTTNLMAAAGAGLSLAIILFIRDQIRGSVIRRKVSGDKISSTQHRLPEEQAVLERRGAQTTVCELQGSLFFGTTDQLFTELTPDLKQCRYLILDLRRVQSVDYTAAHLLEQFEAMLHERGGFLIFSRVPPGLRNGGLAAYFSDLEGATSRRSVRQFESLDDALEWVENRIIATEFPGGGEEVPLALGEIDLLREFAVDQTLAAIASCAAERTVAAGQFVFKTGDVGDELFLIRRGVVRIVLPLKNGGHHNLASFGRGHFFGEIAFLDQHTRSANAVATTAVDLFVLSRARFDEVARDHPLVDVKMFARLARTLAIRLRHTDAELRAIYES